MILILHFKWEHSSSVLDTAAIKVKASSWRRYTWKTVGEDQLTSLTAANVRSIQRGVAV